MYILNNIYLSHLPAISCKQLSQTQNVTFIDICKKRDNKM